MDDAIASGVTRKLTVRLVHLASLLFFLNYLDRVGPRLWLARIMMTSLLATVLAFSLGPARPAAMPAAAAR